jgi:cytochrome c-type biogenesis protein CcmH/NrfG
MRVARIVLAIAFAVCAVASWAKYDAIAKPKLSFADRWAPVDEATSSGEFRHR